MASVIGISGALRRASYNAALRRGAIELHNTVGYVPDANRFSILQVARAMKTMIATNAGAEAKSLRANPK